MCTVLLPPGVNPIAVNKYIYEFHDYQTWYEFRITSSADVSRFYTGTSRLNTALTFCTLAFTSK